MKTKAQRRRCHRRRLAADIDFKYFRPKMLQKAADIILEFFFLWLASASLLLLLLLLVALLVFFVCQLVASLAN